MWATIVDHAGLASSFLFLFQILMQVKLYGLKGWFHWGLGTGVSTDKHEQEALEENVYS